MIKLKTTSFAVGDIVKAVSGRDCGKLFAVVAVIDENYVLIANGRSRRLESPKRKKIKHLNGVCKEGGQAKVSKELIALMDSGLTDNILWREISSFTEK